MSGKRISMRIRSGLPEIAFPIASCPVTAPRYRNHRIAPVIEAEYTSRHHCHRLLEFASLTCLAQYVESGAKKVTGRVTAARRSAALRARLQPGVTMRFGPLVEVGNRVTATHLLYPDVLDARYVICLIDL